MVGHLTQKVQFLRDHYYEHQERTFCGFIDSEHYRYCYICVLLWSWFIVVFAFFHTLYKVVKVWLELRQTNAYWVNFLAQAWLGLTVYSSFEFPLFVLGLYFVASQGFLIIPYWKGDGWTKVVQTLLLSAAAIALSGCEWQSVCRSGTSIWSSVWTPRFCNLKPISTSFSEKVAQINNLADRSKAKRAVMSSSSSDYDTIL